jgi:hypothetical protein
MGHYSLETSREPIFDLEEKIQCTLYPVRPNPEFVNHLRNRLTHPSSVIVEQPGRRGMVWAVLAGGLAFGALLVWLLRR